MNESITQGAALKFVVDEYCRDPRTDPFWSERFISILKGGWQWRCGSCEAVSVPLKPSGMGEVCGRCDSAAVHRVWIEVGE